MRRGDDGGFEARHKRWSPLRTSRTEIIHLTAAIVVFFIVEAPLLVFIIEAPLLLQITILFTFIGISALAFALHELAHKFTAQHYGLWSEFRLDPLGMVISLLTALSPFKIIAPGSVFISGFGVTKEKMGVIAVAGPLANIIQTLVFTFLSQFSTLSSFWWLPLAAALNADLAMFNLIPISVLDGRKVFTWNLKAWALLFAMALILWIIHHF
jgi:Zn-dependent protease